jgi:hypothetical protein
MHPAIWPSATLAFLAGYLRIAGFPKRKKPKPQ